MPSTDLERVKRILNKDMDRTDPISVQRYTRTGRLKKKMDKPQHENSIRALENNRADTQFNGPKARRCRLCRRLAVRELDVCYFHGGRAYLWAKRRKQKQGPIGKTSEVATRNTRNLFLSQAVPFELYQIPIFLEVARFALPRQFGVKYNGKLHGPRRRASRLLLREMILAWVAAQEGDPGPWSTAVAKARALGFE